MLRASKGGTLRPASHSGGIRVTSSLPSLSRASSTCLLKALRSAFASERLFAMGYFAADLSKAATCSCGHLEPSGACRRLWFGEGGLVFGRGMTGPPPEDTRPGRKMGVLIRAVAPSRRSAVTCRQQRPHSIHRPRRCRPSRPSPARAEKCCHPSCPLTRSEYCPRNREAVNPSQPHPSWRLRQGCSPQYGRPRTPRY